MKNDYNKILTRITSRDQLISKFDIYIKMTNELLLNFNHAANPRLHQKLYQNILQRLYISIKAIRYLFFEFDRNKYFRFPLAVQMRVAILDSITASYMLSFIDVKSDQKLKTELARLEQPIARDFDTELKKIEIENGVISKDEREILAELFPNNFDENKRLNKKIKDLCAGTMITGLKATQLSWFTESYGVYRYFSQYEHFSMISKKLLESNADKDFDQFVYSTFWVFSASHICMQVLGFEASTVNQMKELRDSIIDIEPLTSQATIIAK